MGMHVKHMAKRTTRLMNMSPTLEKSEVTYKQFFIVLSVYSVYIPLAHITNREQTQELICRNFCSGAMNEYIGFSIHFQTFVNDQIKEVRKNKKNPA